MENRNGKCTDRSDRTLGQTRAACPPQAQTATAEVANDEGFRGPLSQAELKLLVEFFELLDRWDREVVQ
jgi:hypothetical protein